MARKVIVAGLMALVAGAAILAQQGRPMSPSGAAATQVLGKWTTGGVNFTLGRGSYSGGKWIEMTFGRPLRRGRDLWGSGVNYGKDALVGAPIWRAGSDVTTRLKSEVPLAIGSRVIPAGEYSVFIDLKETGWTFVLSSLPIQPSKYDPNEKVATWGAYNYTPDKDVLRTTMKLETLPHSHEQLTWEFLDMTDTSGTLAMTWGNTMATVPFKVG